MLNAVLITPVNTWNEVYVAPALKRSVVTLNVSNHANSAVARIKVAIGPTSSGAITNAHVIEPGTSINGLSVLERTGLVLNASQKLWVQADTLNTGATVYGIEELI